MPTHGSEEVFTTWITDLEATDVSIVCLCGELDASSTPAFLSDIHELAGGKRNVVMDVHLLSYIDSTGVSALLSIRGALERAGRWVCLVGCHGLLTRLLEVTRIEGQLRCFPDTESAIAEMHGGKR